YDQQKNLLIQSEEGDSWDSNAKRTASQKELTANRIIIRIREDERDHLFGNRATEAIPGPETLDMGGQFLTNRNRIHEKSKLYRIALEMPKGCHLHLHFNSELPPMPLLEKARCMDNMFIRSTQPILSSQDLEVTEIVFTVLPADTETVDIFSPGYNPAFRPPDATRPWMRWKDFRKIYSERFESQMRLPVEEYIRRRMILTDEEVYAISQTTNGIWARFNQGTRCFKGLMNYESIYRWYIGAAIDSMIRDKVMYAELRPMLLDKSIPSDDGMRKLDHEAQMNIILEEVQIKQVELEREGRLKEFPFGVKIIYSTPRSIPKAMMKREMQDCISLKLKFPDLICGFDLVGAEDRPNNIGFYSEELAAFNETCKSLNISIPYMFHAGETLLDRGGSKTPLNSNLYDAIIFNAKRIGHGFSLLKHPQLVQEFKERQICIELCPTSNELLHLCRNIKEHPYPHILAAGIPCTVNSDNPSLFSSSVSDEFYQVMVGSTTMNLHGWRQLAEWSITHSCLSDGEKTKAFEIFWADWERYCDWVIETY
ncbi:Metallo-dependent hydrolase, partial [Eremomyces bilateralis CBS 781.70]